MNNDSKPQLAPGQKSTSTGAPSSPSTQGSTSMQGNTSMTSGAPGTSAPSGAKAVVDQAAKAATDIASKAKDKVGDQIGAQLDAQKERAVGSIGGVVDALRGAGQSLRENETGMPTQYVDQAADQIERLTGYVKNRTIGELAGDLERFARREPAIFLGGAFTLGVIAGRFLKSSAPRTGSSESPSGESPSSSRITDPGFGTLDNGNGGSKRTL